MGKNTQLCNEHVTNAEQYSFEYNELIGATMLGSNVYIWKGNTNFMLLIVEITQHLLTL